MILLPYRAKNPPARFPAATYGLIAANVVAFACTSDYFLAINDGALHTLAFSNTHLSLLRMLTAMFLHESIFHLAGNMLFLWIFGTAVEGRLGPIRFLLLYLLAGIAGDLLQIVTVGQVYPHLWNLGASGAIMGLAGAYLFMFPFATICVFYAWGWRIGLADWQAQWVILYFLGFDLLEGILYQGLDGVGHFAHLGGAAFGFLLPFLLQMPRDSEEASSAQAVRNDAGGDYSILAYHELESLVENDPGNPRLVLAFCHKAMTKSEMNGPRRAMEILEQHTDALLAHSDTEAVTQILLTLPESAGPAPAHLLMKLGARLESSGDYESATNCYRRLYNENSNHPDAQTALIRWARLTEHADADKRNAAALYTELLRRFPNGSQSLYAESALRRLGFERPRFDPAPPSPASQNDTASPAGGYVPPTMGTVGEAASPFTPPVTAEGPSVEKVITPVWESNYHVGETRGMVLKPIGGDAVATEGPA